MYTRIERKYFFSEPCERILASSENRPVVVAGRAGLYSRQAYASAPYFR